MIRSQEAPGVMKSTEIEGGWWGPRPGGWREGAQGTEDPWTQMAMPGTLSRATAQRPCSQPGRLDATVLPGISCEKGAWHGGCETGLR